MPRASGLRHLPISQPACCPHPLRAIQPRSASYARDHQLSSLPPVGVFKLTGPSYAINLHAALGRSNSEPGADADGRAAGANMRFSACLRLAQVAGRGYCEVSPINSRFYWRSLAGFPHPRPPYALE